MKTTTLLLPILALFVSGCAITQVVRPVASASSDEICLISNPAVREGFVETLTTALTAKGYKVRALPANTSIDACPLTATYTANWTWDLALYMSLADIRVYAGGKPAGEAVYDSRTGGANMSKFIKADEKIRELVNQLFPGGTRR